MQVLPAFGYIVAEASASLVQSLPGLVAFDLDFQNGRPECFTVMGSTLDKAELGENLWRDHQWAGSFCVECDYAGRFWLYLNDSAKKTRMFVFGHQREKGIERAHFRGGHRVCLFTGIDRALIARLAGRLRQSRSSRDFSVRGTPDLRP